MAPISPVNPTWSMYPQIIGLDPWVGSYIGAMHALDVGFFLGNQVGIEAIFELLGITVATEQNRLGREALSEAMMAYVARFVRTGCPNVPGSGFPEWTPWSNKEGESKCILFDAGYDDIDIKMSTTELTAEGLRAEINALPEYIAEHLWFDNIVASLKMTAF